MTKQEIKNHLILSLIELGNEISGLIISISSISIEHANAMKDEYKQRIKRMENMISKL